MPFLSPSLFSELAYEELRRKHAVMIWKSSVIRTIFPTLCGSMGIPNGRNVIFDGLDAMVEDIPHAQPALYDGALPAEIDKRVKDDLYHLIMPSATDSQSLAVPNVFVEIKAPSEDANLVRCRACYNGALGARAIHSLQMYCRDKPVYDNKAYVITMIYHPETATLQIYTTHVTQPASPEGLPEYHMTQMGSWNLTANYDSFQRGVTAFRNARDWAKEHRDRLIEEANAKVRGSA